MRFAINSATFPLSFFLSPHNEINANNELHVNRKSFQLFSFLLILSECLSKCKGNQFCGPTLRADNINANAEAMKKRVSLFLEYMTTGSNDFKIPSLFYSLAVIAVVTSNKLRKKENEKIK